MIIAKGPTDKAALQRIIKRDDDNHDEDDNTAYNRHSDRREIAKLVLQCRELLTTTTNYNDNCDDDSGIDEQKQQQKQLLLSPTSPLASVPLSTRNYSNSALWDTMDEDDANDDAHQVETTESSFPIIEADIKKSLSPTTYERMVMNLFPNDNNNNERGNTEEEYYNSIHHADATDTDTNYTNNAIIHPYWIEPLLSLTKSSSRSLVKQLSTNTNCPKGYDPTASNLSGSTTASTTTMSTTSTASPLLSYIQKQKSSYFLLS